MGFERDNFPPRAHFSRKWENVLSAPCPNVDHDISRFRFVFVKPEVLRVSKVFRDFILPRENGWFIKIETWSIRNDIQPHSMLPSFFVSDLHILVK
jgi:hypothetical protein